MDCLNCTVKEFQFNYQSPSSDILFEEIIKIPFEPNVTIREYGYILMKKHQISDQLEDDLMEKLQSFYDMNIDQIQCENSIFVLKNHHKLLDQSNQFIEKLKNSSTLPDIKSQNQNSKNEESKDDFSEKEFYTMYHKIIHSGKLTQQLIRLENHNSDVIRNLMNEKNESLNILSQEQNKKIEDILISNQYSEKEINLLTQKNIALAEKNRNEWLQKIRNIRNDQKREFYTWIKNTYEDLMKEDATAQNVKTNSNDQIVSNEDKDNSFSDFVDISDELEMQESYTINLGSQLKTTHNLRLIAADMLKFCSNLSTPHRIQTAMSLYSNSLSAVVLLADQSLISSATKKSEFARMVMNTSENHFPGLDLQIESIKNDLEHLRSSMKYSSKQRNGQNYRLKTGDVYITKHSNLSEAHVVFHIVTEDAIRHSEINSRHPIILGLRNILKIVYIHDISNIYIPLLLIDEMYEDITIQWCLKRAELILKCVKGFMIEMSSLLSISDSENKTLQFVVPKGISQNLFQNLSSIFPTVFRLSNPLFLTKNDI